MNSGGARARDLGIPFEGMPGQFNAISDVVGVEVGHVTLISGEGALRVGEGPVRTGVTAILPCGKTSVSPSFAGWFALNGNGEMTGTAWIEEAGLLSGPILLTNTHSVGITRDAVIAWQMQQGKLPGLWSLPMVAETWDGWLNDINGFHVRPEHVFAALDGATSGAVAEGNVGGGTGMICHGFKGGIGTASRVISTSRDSEKNTDTGAYTVGVLVQANHGLRHQLRVAGVPVGQKLREWSGSASEITSDAASAAALSDISNSEHGSIIGIVATDAPLLPHQCRALAKRASLGMARTGGVAGIGSGDLFLAFSTGNLNDEEVEENTTVTMLGLNRISALFEATVQAMEEAIVNALVAARTMTGIENRTIHALPHDRLTELMKLYGRTEG